MDTLIEFEAPREAPLSWVWWRAPHEAQKNKFWDIILLFEATRPCGASWYDSNTKKWGRSWGDRVWGTLQIWMVLHDIMRCLILCIPLQEPNKTKIEVPQKFGITMESVMPCLGITSLWGNFGPICLSLIFTKKGASFLSLRVDQATTAATARRAPTMTTVTATTVSKATLRLAPYSPFVTSPGRDTTAARARQQGHPWIAMHVSS